MEVKCFLCCEETENLNSHRNEDKNQNDTQKENLDLDCCVTLSKQLRVIFILKNVLDSPTQKLETYLQKFGNPEEWDVTLCSKCSEEVDRIQELFLQLKTTYKLYEDARRKVKMKVVSLNSSGRDDDKNNLSEIGGGCRDPSLAPVEGLRKSHSSFSSCVGKSVIVEEIKTENEYIDIADDADYDDVDSTSSWNRESDCNYSNGFQVADLKEDASRDISVPISSPLNQGEVKDENIPSASRRRRSQRICNLKLEPKTDDRLDLDALHSDDSNDADIGGDDKDADYSEANEEEEKGSDDEDYCQESEGEGGAQKSRSRSKILTDYETFVDNGKRKYLCKYEGCGKVFSDRKWFRGHVERHEGRVPKFKCDDCGKRFHVRRSLFKHRLCVHRKSTPLAKELLKNSKNADSESGSEFDQRGNHNDKFVNTPPKYQCNFEGCTNAYRTHLNFLVHMAKHEGKSPTVPCPDCDQCFYFPEEVRRHRYFKHGRRLKVKKTIEETSSSKLCSECGKTFKLPSELEKHVKKCGKQLNAKESSVKKSAKTNSRKYVCTYEGCGKIFADRKWFRGHTARHEGSDPKFECSDCGKQFYVRKSLFKHRLGVHKKTTPSKAELLNITDSTPAPTAVPELDQYKDNIIERDNIRLYQCNFKGCTMTYKERKRFSVHMAKHEGKPPHLKCPDCDKSFYLQNDLSHHRAQVHGPEDVASSNLCSQCGKCYVSDYQMRKHAQRCGKEMLECTKCSQKYFTEKGLERHVCGEEKAKSRTEKIWNCKICDKQYRSAKGLRNHVAFTHEMKNSQHVCDICGYVLKRRRAFLIHMANVHNVGKFKCKREECGKQFSSTIHLENHEKYVHLGVEKPRSKICNYCGKGFYNSKALRYHIEAMHTQRESKPWKCEVCGKGFAIQTYLIGHRRIHKKNEEDKVKDELIIP